MKIEYIGHACFRITGGGMAWVCDPYDGSIGLDRPAVSADVTTLSHQHFDHNCLDALDGAGTVLSAEGEYDVGGAHFTLIKAYHDEVQGGKRGEDLITVCELEGMRICHMGDIGHQLSDELLARIGRVDLLMLPVGGTYTVDGEGAARMARAIAPRAVVPMHFKTGKLSINIAAPDAFLAAMGGHEKVGSELELTADTQGVILMQPAR